MSGQDSAEVTDTSRVQCTAALRREGAQCHGASGAMTMHITCKRRTCGTRVGHDGTGRATRSDESAGSEGDSMTDGEAEHIEDSGHESVAEQYGEGMRGTERWQSTLLGVI